MDNSTCSKSIVKVLDCESTHMFLPSRFTAVFIESGRKDPIRFAASERNEWRSGKRIKASLDNFILERTYSTLGDPTRLRNPHLLTRSFTESGRVAPIE